MRAHLVLLGIALSLAACSTRAARDPQKLLEERLMAPCCWRQNLADHDSPLTTQLRAEIAQRLQAGEAAPEIEEALVSRYGERMRALGAGADPRLVIGAVSAAATLAGLAFLVWFARRRRSRAAPLEPSASPEGAPRRADRAAQDDDVNERLDDELAAYAD